MKPKLAGRLTRLSCLGVIVLLLLGIGVPHKVANVPAGDVPRSTIRVEV